MKKISILYENMHSCKADDYYTDVISPPPQRNVSSLFCFHCHHYNSNSNHFVSQTVSNRETEVQTEDEQQFLARQQQLLQQGQTQTRGESPMRTPQAAGKTVPRTSVCQIDHFDFPNNEINGIFIA